MQDIVITKEVLLLIIVVSTYVVGIPIAFLFKYVLGLLTKSRYENWLYENQEDIAKVLTTMLPVCAPFKFDTMHDFHEEEEHEAAKLGVLDSKRLLHRYNDYINIVRNGVITKQLHFSDIDRIRLSVEHKIIGKTRWDAFLYDKNDECMIILEDSNFPSLKYREELEKFEKH